MHLFVLGKWIEDVDFSFFYEKCDFFPSGQFFAPKGGNFVG